MHFHGVHRDTIMKRYKDLSVNSQAVTKELNDITNKIPPDTTALGVIYSKVKLTVTYDT